jgi:uncharacterized protein involved in exopolysaccharide biosynthesis
MSGWTPDAAAAHEDAAAGASFAPRGGPIADETPGLIVRIALRWWLVAVGIAAGVGAAVVLLAVVSPTYTAVAVISTDYGATAKGDVAPDVFLTTQRRLIESAPMLSAAGARAEQLQVTTSKGDGTITIRYDAGSAAGAARAANALADRYVAHQTGAQTAAARALADLARERDQAAARRSEAERALKDFRTRAGAGAGEADRATAARLEQLHAAVAAAQVALATAQASVDGARELESDTQRLHQAVDANSGSGIYAALDQQRDRASAELAQLEPKLARQRKTMLPQHPVLQATQRRVRQLQATLAALDQQYADAYRGWLEQQRQAAQQKLDELQALAKRQQAAAKDMTSRAAREAALEAAVKSADADLASLDDRLRAINLSGDALSPGTKVLIPADVPSSPSRPDRRFVLSAGAAGGLLLGLLLAAFAPIRR